MLAGTTMWKKRENELLGKKMNFLPSAQTVSSPRLVTPPDLVHPGKILLARLQQYVNHELLDVQAGFRKGRGTRDQIANIR